MDATDRDLLGLLARGDPEALAPLMERHHRRLYRVALSYLRDPDLALDVVQETFVRAFQNAGRWDGTSDAAPWLTRIAVNLSIDQYRRGQRRRKTEEPLGEADHADRIAGDDPSPERVAFGREVSNRIGAALEALPARQRAVFVLRHYDEMSLDEIAATLGLSLGTVKSSLHRAVGRLRTRLGGLRT